MFGLLKPRLPVSDDQRRWADDAFLRLAKLLGADRMLEATVFLPEPEYFPDRYDASEEALLAMFRRVSTGMQVDPDTVDITLFFETEQITQSLVPFGSLKSKGAGGLYHHTPEVKAHISVNSSKLKDPLSLVATLAHELGHVILLRPDLVAREEIDMEPLTDLVTVFLGFGVFNANAAFQFKQYTNNDSQGWSTQRLGYLSEEMFGYSLARFAFERGELNPDWASYLSTNVSVYFKRSLGWLKTNGARILVDR